MSYVGPYAGSYDFSPLPNLKKCGSVNIGWHISNDTRISYTIDNQCTKKITKKVWAEVFTLFAIHDINFRTDSFTVKSYYNRIHDYTVIFITYSLRDDGRMVEFMYENGNNTTRNIIEKYTILMKDEILKHVGEDDE